MKNQRRTFSWLDRLDLPAILSIACMACVPVAIVTAQEWLEQLPPGELAAPNSGNLETLTRGPMHEAFGASTGRDPAPGRIISRPVPAEIDELPPAIPEELNTQSPVWIPGYWAWDDEREDFLWISGAWRVAPEGRQWTPGFWTEVADGWQWVAGYWSLGEAGPDDFVQQPPASLEAGPSTQPPGPDHFWIPGNWIDGVPGWQWQPGRWCAFREDQVWIPSHYVYSPAGCIFVSGYWDYPLRSRGVLYAPVYFHAPVVSYRPSCLLQSSRLLLHLFVNAHDHHYYFGDYYDVAYRNRGCYPIYDYRRAACRFDPLLTYYTAHYGRRGIDCHQRFRSWHHYYATHVNHRPPRTLAAQVSVSIGNVGVNHAYSKLAQTGRTYGDVHPRGHEDRRRPSAREVARLESPPAKAQAHRAKLQRDRSRQISEKRRRQEVETRKVSLARTKHRPNQAQDPLATGPKRHVGGVRPIPPPSPKLTNRARPLPRTNNADKRQKPQPPVVAKKTLPAHVPSKSPQLRRIDNRQKVENRRENLHLRSVTQQEKQRQNPVLQSPQRQSRPKVKPNVSKPVHAKLKVNRPTIKPAPAKPPVARAPNKRTPARPASTAASRPTANPVRHPSRNVQPPPARKPAPSLNRRPPARKPPTPPRVRRTRPQPAKKSPRTSATD